MREVMVPSSSGLGRLVLIQKIAGSTPAGITMGNLALKLEFETVLYICKEPFFCWLISRFKKIFRAKMFI